MTGARVSHVHGRHGVEAIDVIERRPHDEDRMRCARGFRRLESGRAPDLPSRRQAGVERGDRRVHARHDAARHACRGRGERRADARPNVCTGGIAAGAMAAVECGCQIASITLPRAEDEPAAIAPLWHVKESRAKAFVDFQNDVTVNDIALADQRGLQRGRAPQALHHARHGDRPGQDRERHRPCDPRRAVRPQHSAGRHHDLSAALRAGELRRDGRPPSRPAISVRSGCTPSHQWAAEQGAVFVETGAWLRAQYYPRAGEKDWLETVNREVTATRGSVGVCDVSTLRQDRDRGRGCRRVPRSRLRQHVLDACRSARRAMR